MVSRVIGFLGAHPSPWGWRPGHWGGRCKVALIPKRRPPSTTGSTKGVEGAKRDGEDGHSVQKTLLFSQLEK